MKSKDFCFLDLNLSCFKPRGPPEKFYIAKNFLVENKISTNNINEHFCHYTKNSYWLSFRDNWGDKFGSKIHVFRIFWPLDGVKITRKRRFWTRSVPKHRNRHLTRLSTPKDGRTLQKVCGPLLPKSVVHFYPGNLVRLG